MRNVPDKTAEKVITHNLFSITFFFSENRAVCEIMWKNIVERVRPQMKTLYGPCPLHAG